MIDAMTNKRICIEHNSSICLSVSQVSEVCSLLEVNDVSYTLDEDAISLDSGPEMTYITIRDGTKTAFVQMLLDKSEENKYEMPQVIIPGKQIGFGRRKIIDRAVDIILADSKDKDIDWQKHNLLIQVVDK